MILRRTLLSLAMLFSLAASASTADSVIPYRCQKEVLPNGLTVLMIPMHGSGLVSYFTVVRTGSRDEVEPGRSGYAHFFEHMMFHGTKKNPAPVYAGIVTALGAQANAFTTDDLTCYHLTFANEDLAKIVEIESDRFQNLTYEKRAFQTEAGAVYGEYRIGAASPWFALEEKLHDTAYDAHTYKHTTIGFEADVKAMPQAYDYSLSFYRRFYRPENIVLLIVGDFDPKSTLGLIEKYYGPWQKGYEPPKITPEPPQTAPRRADIAFPGRTLPILDIAYKGDAFDPANRDYVAARLLGDLAFGPQSDLYKKLVLREQKVESLHCEIPMNRDASLFEIVAVVKRPEDVDSIDKQIRGTLAEFKTKPVDRAKLDALKRRDRYAFIMGMDSTESVAGQLARFIALTGGIEAVDQLFAASATITPEEIMHAAGKYFVPERRTTILLKSKEEPQAASQESSRPGASPSPSTVLPKPNESLAASRGRLLDMLEEHIFKESVPPSPHAKLPPPVLLPIPSDPTISFRLWFIVGSWNDPPGKEGLASITAAMIAEGATLANSYEQILDKLTPLAAGYSASATEEMTVISGRVHRDNLDRFYPLLIEAVTKPAFKQEDLDRIKARMLNYLQNTLRSSNDEELGKAVLYTGREAGATLYGSPQGTLEGIRSISLDDVMKFYTKYYVQHGLVVGLGGGYDSTLPDRMKVDLATLPLGSAGEVGQRRMIPPRIGVAFDFDIGDVNAPREKPVLRSVDVTIVEKDCDATAISMGFGLGDRSSKDWYALALANCWLGQHRNDNGRLYQFIREARGLNYGDYSYIEHFPNGGELDVPPTNVCRSHQLFEIWIRPVPNADRHFALRAALREFEKFVDKGLTEEDFRKTQKFLRKFVLHLAPTTMDRLGYAIDDRFYEIQGSRLERFFGIKGSHLENFRRAMDELTLADVNAAIKNNLRHKDMQIVIVTKDAESLKKALVAETPSPITYATPKPESVLAEDREISVFPLHIKPDKIRIVPVNELFEK